MESWRTELYHYGIKGQQWGVRRGPPYPIDAAARNSSGRKSGSALRGVKDRKVDKIRRKYGNIGDSGTSLSHVTFDADNMVQKYGFPLKEPPNTSVASDIKAVNPGWWDKYETDMTWANNCTHCVVAFSARRKGLDVTATPVSQEEGKAGGVCTFDLLSRCYRYQFDDTEDLDNNRDFHYVNLRTNFQKFMGIHPNGKSYEKRVSDEMTEFYKDAPDGANGTIEMQTLYGGHIFNWYKEDGKVKFADPQVGLNAGGNFDNLSRYDVAGWIMHVRLDDKEFDPKGAQEAFMPAKQSAAHSIFTYKSDNFITTTDVTPYERGENVMSTLVLLHHGIRGQKWGVRRFQNADGSLTSAGRIRYNAGRASLSTKYHAYKDAKETARAKAYYGEGAGNRRKLIAMQVKERQKDPDYAAKYEKYLAKQDMGEHARAAKRERALHDTGKNIRRTVNTLEKIGALAVTAASVAAIANKALNDRRVGAAMYKPLITFTNDEKQEGRNI